MTDELPVVFSCQDDQLIGIIHKPAQVSHVGVLIVVGGPQYRVGSHRQFILLARMLAENGIAVMRFDHRGMGDSEGKPRSFADSDEDIAAALDCFYQECPELRSVVIWGLCDAASAALFYGYQDQRVRGLVLLNPWVFTQQGAAKTVLKHYYVERLLSPAFWRKVCTFQFDYLASLRSLIAIFHRLLFAGVNTGNAVAQAETAKVDSSLDLPMRMRECFRRFDKPVLFILSGRDLTADEFKDLLKTDLEWQTLMQRDWVERHDFADADHTFSSARNRDKVADVTLNWIKGVLAH